MRLSAGLALLGALAVAALWASGGLATLAWRLAEAQRALQGLLAGEIAALRGGDPAALWALIGLCGAYGFLHALGPGHGKALVAGAAVGTRATARRMALLALAGSLAQAGVAIAVVYGGFTLLGVTARGLTGGVAAWLDPLGGLAVALFGAFILARGLLALRAAAPGAGPHRHGPGCGHAHGPTQAEAAQATGPGATLALIGGMAARPCTGAIVVLVIAWRMGLPGAGAAAALAMGFGTASFTMVVAWLAVRGRDSALVSAGPGGAVGRLLAPALQIVAGILILAVGGLPLIGALAR